MSNPQSLPIEWEQAPVTDAQRRAIEAQARYYSHADCPADGLHHARVYDVGQWGEADTATSGRVAVDFTYRYPDEDAYGLETTIFDRGGVAVESQDFG